MHNAIFLGQQNELLRDANAKPTIKRAKSTQRLSYRGGYIAGETNEPVVGEKKQPAEQLTEQVETTLLLPHRVPPRCTKCWELENRRNQ